ncbi:MAG: hypothetical protein BGO14_03650 [Chlamydiales bacterium 38-26]|nr:hypothetical protein [Chlamydiales bacterium]OJV09428.1 MAG: hypothetical protein BGO14_03650 [Chlamydiales bacterium 38-26]
MKKLTTIAACTFLGFASLQAAAQSGVQSYTNSDLNQIPGINPPSSSTIPGISNSPSSNTPTSFKYPALTPEQIQQFNEQMAGQVQNAEQRVQSLMNMVQDRTRMPMSIDKVQLEGAITDLDVKKTLVSKFQSSPSLKSPKVRQVLMQILGKDFIQESDLAALQAVVNEERPYTYP